MERSIRQIELELETLVNAMMRVNQFIFKDFVEAYDENLINHSAVICHIPFVNPTKDYHDVTVRIFVVDKVFDQDLRNESDVRSDTYRTLEEMLDIIGNSVRWTIWGKIASVGQALYIRYGGSDIVFGWQCDIILRVSTTRPLCEIPLSNYDLNYVPEIPE